MSISLWISLSKYNIYIYIEREIESDVELVAPVPPQVVDKLLMLRLSQTRNMICKFPAKLYVYDMFSYLNQRGMQR